MRIGPISLKLHHAYMITKISKGKKKKKLVMGNGTRNLKVFFFEISSIHKFFFSFFLFFLIIRWLGERGFEPYKALGAYTSSLIHTVIRWVLLR